MSSSYTSWGRVLRPQHELLPLASRHAPLPALPDGGATMLPYGNGRSYEAAVLDQGNVVAQLTEIDMHFLH